MAKYVQYGFRCAFGIADHTINEKFYNGGECDGAIWVIILYCLSFFII